MSKTKDEIVDEIIDETTTEIPQISNYRVGGVFRLFIEVVASFLEKIYSELEALLPNRFLQTATGEWLDQKAEELSLTRYPATKTKGYVVFTREDSSKSLTVNKDKILASKNGLRYKVVADVEMAIDVGAIGILVEAEFEGSNYNVIGEQITEIITPISGVDSITNSSDWVVSVGTDEESDDSLRSRCLALWSGLSGANADAYISWAKSIEGIGDVRVISTARGVGTVDVVCVGADNVQPNEDLLDLVRENIETLKPISSDVSVQAPLEEFFNINLTVTTKPTYTITQDNIQDAIISYFASCEIGSDFEPSALASYIFSVDGVKSVTVNTPQSTRLTEFQIARVGDIAIELINDTEN